MGFFSSVLYSTTEHELTEQEARRAVTYLQVPTLKQDQERMVQEAILARRGGDGKISLQQIYEVLTGLKGANKISKYDREGVLKVMNKLFEKI